MAASKSNIFIFILLALTTTPLLVATSARALNNVPIRSSASLASRLNLNDESSNCWDSLFQLQACSGEFIMFFVNGQTYLGPGCCKAIRTIEHDCWPALLGTLGYTTAETYLLEGYCDEADHIQSPPSTTPAPSPSPSPPPPPPSVNNAKVVPGLEKLVP